MTTRDDDIESWDDAIPIDEFRKRRAALTKLPGTGPAITLGGRDDWRDLLRWDKGTKKNPGGPTKCLENVLTTLLHCPGWQGVVRHNSFTDRLELSGALPTTDSHPIAPAPGPWRDGYALWVIAWCNAVLGFEPSLDHTNRAIEELARRNAWHPVRTYLDALRWDGTPRLNGMLHKLFGAEDTQVNQAIGSMWCISAVARIMRPGCQVDHMLVLEGPQGTRKSTALRTLVGDEWFRNSPLDLTDKDSMMALLGCWVYEFDELDSFRGRAATRVKSFVTSRVDSYRPTFERRTVDRPRECVFAGSTNEERYLSDPTGNRRFWPVLCGAIDIPGLASARDQLWAEAAMRFRDGELWYVPDGELAVQFRTIQSERQEIDPWMGMVEKWLDELTLVAKLDGITTHQALGGALDMKGGAMGKADENRMGHVLRSFGMIRRRGRTGNGTRPYKYYPAAPPEEAQDLPGFEGEAG